MVVTGAQHRRAQRPVLVELEAFPALGVQLLVQPGLARTDGLAYREVTDRVDHLVGHTVDLDVGGAQDLVARRDITDGRDQRSGVTRPAEPGGERNVVDCAGPVDAVGEPGSQL